MKPSILLSNKALVSSKGQVVIPYALRTKLGIHSGNEILFTVRSDGVIELRPIKKSIDLFIGCCQRKNEKPMTIQEMDEAIMEAVSKK